MIPLIVWLQNPCWVTENVPPPFPHHCFPNLQSDTIPKLSCKSISAKRCLLLSNVLFNDQPGAGQFHSITLHTQYENYTTFSHWMGLNKTEWNGMTFRYIQIHLVAECGIVLIVSIQGTRPFHTAGWIAFLMPSKGQRWCHGASHTLKRKCANICCIFKGWKSSISVLQYLSDPTADESSWWWCWANQNKELLRTVTSPWTLCFKLLLI